MQDVRVIGVESGALLLATDGGSEFRLSVTPSLPAQVRQANPTAEPQKHVSPKEVQARIRAGVAAEDVAAALDIDVEAVRRFEGPVLAERAFILDTAQRVPVTTTDTAGSTTFGDAIQTRLEDGDATNVSWSSWKHAETGWRVQVRYTANDVEYDAQWRFDPKSRTLVAENNDAHRLSRTDPDEGIAPRLRAVEREHENRDSTRFDSGAFDIDAPTEHQPSQTAQEQRPAAPRPTLPRIGAPVEERAPGNETADLLEALRRRRGERESADFGTQTEEQPDRRGTVSTVDVPLEGFDGPDKPNAGNADRPEPSQPDRRRRQRRSMPSWDEIVFGTRPDDDLA